MLMWSEGPGPSPLLVGLFGAQLAGAIPAWERLTIPLLVASAVVLGLWSLLTWSLVARTHRLVDFCDNPRL
jgi:hypothetical protein